MIHRSTLLNVFQSLTLFLQSEGELLDAWKTKQSNRAKYKAISCIINTCLSKFSSKSGLQQGRFGKINSFHSLSEAELYLMFFFSCSSNLLDRFNRYWEIKTQTSDEALNLSPLGPTKSQCTVLLRVQMHIKCQMKSSLWNPIIQGK